MDFDSAVFAIAEDRGRPEHWKRVFLGCNQMARQRQPQLALLGESPDDLAGAVALELLRRAKSAPPLRLPRSYARKMLENRVADMWRRRGTAGVRVDVDIDELVVLQAVEGDIEVGSLETVVREADRAAAVVALGRAPRYARAFLTAWQQVKAIGLTGEGCDLRALAAEAGVQAGELQAYLARVYKAHQRAREAVKEAVLARAACGRCAPDVAARVARALAATRYRRGVRPCRPRQVFQDVRPAMSDDPAHGS